MVQCTSGIIILDCWIKTHDGWVAIVKLLQETNSKRAQEQGHPLEVITQLTGRVMGFNLTVIFKPCEDCALGKTKRDGIC